MRDGHAVRVRRDRCVLLGSAQPRIHEDEATSTALCGRYVEVSVCCLTGDSLKLMCIPIVCGGRGSRWARFKTVIENNAVVGENWVTTTAVAVAMPKFPTTPSPKTSTDSNAGG